MAWLGPLPGVSQGFREGVSWAAFSSGGSTGEEFTFRLIQVIDREYFLVAVGLRALAFAA